MGAYPTLYTSTSLCQSHALSLRQTLASPEERPEDAGEKERPYATSSAPSVDAGEQVSAAPPLLRVPWMAGGAGESECPGRLPARLGGSRGGTLAHGRAHHTGGGGRSPVSTLTAPGGTLPRGVRGPGRDHGRQPRWHHAPHPDERL